MWPVTSADVPSAVAIAPPRPEQTEPVTSRELAELIGARSVLPDHLSAEYQRVWVSGATLRANQVQPGDLFAALPGSRAHGADFAHQALEAGATVVLTDPAGVQRAGLAEHPQVLSGQVAVLEHPNPREALGPAAAQIYGNPADQLAILGVTGTSGKTTTAYLLDSVLRAAGATTGVIGTVETRIAGRRLDSAFTTPEAPDLQALFAVMLEQGVSHVLMEVSSHALALHRVAGTRFAVGGFTNLSQDHLDFHRDLEDYFSAKALLFDGRCDREVVNVDSSYTDEPQTGGSWGQKLVKPHTATVSLTELATWMVTDRVSLPDGQQRFTALGPAGVRLDVQLRLPGRFNVANALLAAAMAHSAGVGPEAIRRGLSTVEVPGRMEPVTVGQNFTAVVDYSHKPGAVGAVLEAARAQITERAQVAGSQAAAAKIICVLGCGGDRDQAKRAAMGEAAARAADLLIVTDDNPRSEDPAAIRAAMLNGAFEVPEEQRAELREVGDRRAAIGEAIWAARPGDVVVVAGKGHETGQEIGGVVYPFSDRDEVRAALVARSQPQPPRRHSDPTEPG